MLFGLSRWWNDGSVMTHAGFPEGIGETQEDTVRTIRKREGTSHERCIIEIQGQPVGEISFPIHDGTAYPGWKIGEPSAYEPRLWIRDHPDAVGIPLHR